LIRRLIVKRRVLHTVRRIRKERDITMKKIGWRFLRGVVYVFLSGLAAKYAPVLDPILGSALGPGATASLVGGALLALDKYLGIGGLVPYAPAK